MGYCGVTANSRVNKLTISAILSIQITKLKGRKELLCYHTGSEYSVGFHINFKIFSQIRGIAIKYIQIEFRGIMLH